MERTLDLENLGPTFYSLHDLGKVPFPPVFSFYSIILSACLPLRDVVRLRKTPGWKQFVFLSRLPLSVSPPLHPYLWF